MREILFRGKRIYDGEWIVGQLLRLDDGRVRICESGTAVFSYDLDDSIIQTVAHFVYPETVGQYTYMKDGNGKKIFEGDIVKVQDDILGSPYCDGIIGKVVYDEAAFFIEPREKENSLLLFNECAVYEIIGNIHDNPELLEVSHE